MTTRATFIALLSLSLTTPVLAQTTPPCQIQGHVKGLGNKTIVFSYVQQGQQHQDSVRAADDRFTYTTRPSDDGTVILHLVRSPFVRFWNEPGQLTATGSMTEPSHIAIVGTPNNDLLTQYHQTIDWAFDKREHAHPDSAALLKPLFKRATLDFVKAHPRSRTSAYALYWQSMYDDKPVDEYEQLYRQFSSAVKAGPQGQAMAKRLAVLRNQPLVGRKAPTFTIPDTANVAVSLDRFKGQYVLLDFWGHWCGPCIKSMPHLKQLQARYAQQVAVVGIGMEDADDKKAWLDAIHKHQATWTQLCELQGNKGVIQQYNITAFPTYLLLDKQGVVLERANELGAIDEKLKKLVPGK